MFVENHFQNAYVTRNLDKTVSLLKERHGLADFIHFEPDMDAITPRGRGRAVVRAAMAWTGLFQIEIIEPVSGLVDHYLDYLPPDDASMRFHHIAMRTFDWEGTLAEIRRQRRIMAFESAVDGCKFVYVDARESVGHYLEYVWTTPEMWKAIGGS